MWDPVRQMYSTWDDTGAVNDFPAEVSAGRNTITDQGQDDGAPHSAVNLRRPAALEMVVVEKSEGEDEYADEIDCGSTDDSSDGDDAIEARFTAYYKDSAHEGHADYLAERHRDADEQEENEGATHKENDATVSGDWIWDG